MVSIGTYCIVTTLSTAAVLAYAISIKQQYYLTVIHLVNNKFSLMSLCNFIVLLAILFGRTLKSLFFGTLRDMEVESLNENTYYAIIETLLALPVFHEELSLNFMAIFGVLLFIKMFHWLTQCRLDFIEQTPNIGWRTHVRMVTLMGLILTADWVLLYMSSIRVLKNGPSVMMLFVYESIILTSSISSSMIKYAFTVIDRMRDGQWESKGSYVFYLELATDLFQLTVYLIFFGVIASYFRFPLHLVRDVWKTFEGFRQRIGDFIRYRKATSNMRNRYPDATEEELAATDRTCIICRDEMEQAKKLPCGHLFHFACLRSWLERQQTCPTCRTSVLETGPAPAAPAPAQPAPAVPEPAAQPPPAAAAAAAAAGAAEPAPAAQPAPTQTPQATSTTKSKARIIETHSSTPKPSPAAASTPAASSTATGTAAAAASAGPATTTTTPLARHSESPLFPNQPGVAVPPSPMTPHAPGAPAPLPSLPTAPAGGTLPPPPFPGMPGFPPMPGLPQIPGFMPPPPFPGLPGGGQFPASPTLLQSSPQMMPSPHHMSAFGMGSPMHHPAPISPGISPANATMNVNTSVASAPELFEIQEHLLAIQQHQHSVMQLMGRQLSRLASQSPVADEEGTGGPRPEKGKGRDQGEGKDDGDTPARRAALSRQLVSSPLARESSDDA